MKKVLIALGLVVVMLLGVSYVRAQDPGADPKHKWMHESWGQWKRLNFTPEQKARFKELHRKFIEENTQLIGGLAAKRLELWSLWTDPKADSETILAKERELRDLQNQMRDKIVQYKLDFRNFLTPEQIEKLGLMRRMGLDFRSGFRMGHHGQGMGHSGIWQ
jgi:Spy/CpxP family protein refolding chaperone